MIDDISLAECGEVWRRDGVVRLKGALDPEDMSLIEAGFDYRLKNPGPQLQTLYPELGVPVINARGQSDDLPLISRILAETPIGEIVANLFGSGPVWFHGDQLWMKDARGTDKPGRRTPWHQDAAYDPFQGGKVAVVWMNLDPVPADCALEVIRGSHAGPLYNAATFSGDDETAGFFLDTDRPRLPDIQGDRSKWDIVSWPADPGDMLVFHARSLHGGGGVRPGTRRRSLTLRFVGDDVLRAAVPEKRAAVGPLEAKRPVMAADAVPIGQPYHQSGLLQVHPGVRPSA